ncbi:hypothetical protein LJC59_04265 [Desulfovibrio sp. OttesenSCG-928-A18]|nr:hypothetical protein [Desulfovibrio sp. OttesenSCG-928-A18]
MSLAAAAASGFKALLRPAATVLLALALALSLVLCVRYYTIALKAEAAYGQLRAEAAELEKRLTQGRIETLQHQITISSAAISARDQLYEQAHKADAQAAAAIAAASASPQSHDPDAPLPAALVQPLLLLHNSTRHPDSPPAP